jgi:hypothetical protein
VYVTYDPLNGNERAVAKAINDVVSEMEDDVAAVAVHPEPTVTEFLDSVGNSGEFIRLAVQHFAPDEEFGFEELANETGVPVGTLKAYHRNLARTARSLGGDISRLIPARSDGRRGMYRIPPELQTAATK